MSRSRLTKSDRELLLRALHVIEHGTPDENPEYRYAQRAGAARAAIEMVLGLPACTPTRRSSSEVRP